MSNAYLKPEQLDLTEPVFPLDLYLCESCMLAHIETVATSEEIFSDYAYFSSFSTSWLEHCRNYVDMIAEKLQLNENSFVIEVASNDGYLLQYFVGKGIRVLGIEPAANVAQAALGKNIPTMVKYFSEETALELVDKGTRADLLIGNNVLAHVPDLNDFVRGMKILLKEHSVITVEFPHLMRLIEENQFDTIYHEHFSYFSFLTVEQVFTAHGLKLFDVEELPTHGGSLRIYACHPESTSTPLTQRVADLRRREEAFGLTCLETYSSFSDRVEAAKRGLLEFLISVKARGKSIVGYGAPAKGNTLLNYCGVRTDFIDYTVDRSPHKQGLFLPGTRIPIYSPERIRQTKPDYLLILPWNLKDEIMQEMSDIHRWGGKFIVPIPEVKVFP